MRLGKACLLQGLIVRIQAESEAFRRNFLKSFGVWWFPPLVMQSAAFILGATWGILVFLIYWLSAHNHSHAKQVEKTKLVLCLVNKNPLSSTQLGLQYINTQKLLFSQAQALQAPDKTLSDATSSIVPALLFSCRLYLLELDQFTLSRAGGSNFGGYQFLCGLGSLGLLQWHPFGYCGCHIPLLCH